MTWTVRSLCRSFLAARSRQPKPFRRHCRPQVEPLEDRQLLNVTFTDGTFANGDWNLTPFITGGTGSISATQQLVGGNPGAYRQTTNSAAGGAPEMISFQMRNGASYDPSKQGVISGIDYSEDSILLKGEGDGLGAGPALEQNGKFYFGPYFVTPNFVWANHAFSSLLAGDFTLLDLSKPGFADLTMHPDFSASGAAIQFGFFRSNHISDTRSGGIDNWSFTIHSAASRVGIDINDTPDPSDNITLFNAPGTAEPYVQT